MAVPWSINSAGEVVGNSSATAVATGVIIGPGNSPYYVSSGQTDTSDVVVAGGEMYVSGGVADLTTVSNGGSIVTDAGGVASGTVVRGGGLEFVLSNGVASGTVVSGGGKEFVEFNGVASATVVSSGGHEYVGSGGVASGTVVSSGGHFIGLDLTSAYGPWSLSGTNVIDGVTTQSGAIVSLDIYQGGSISGFLVNGGGYESVHSGGVASGTLVSRGIENVYSGGIANDTVLSGGGREYVDGVTIGTVVSGGGHEHVSFDGVASGTTVCSGGVEEINRGVAIGTVVSSGGVEYVEYGGVASDTVLSSGGKEFVDFGGVASGSIVMTGGFERVLSGGIVEGATISGGKIEFASAAAIEAGGTVTVADGGTLTLQGNVNDAGTIALSAAELVVGIAGTSLDGGGAVNLSDSSENIITGAAPGATLTNKDTISGAGQIGQGDLSLTLVNPGTINATGANALTIHTGNSFANTGTLEASGTGGLVVDDAVTGHGHAEIFSNSIMTFASAVATGVTFENNNGNSGSLVLDAAQSFKGTVAGLAQGDGIDLANFLFSGNPTISKVTGTGAAGTTTNVTVSDGTQNLVVKLMNAAAGEFAVNASAYLLTTDSNAANPGTRFQLAAPHA